MKKSRLILNILAAVVILVSIVVVGITGNAFNAVVSHTILTLALLLLEVSAIIGIIEDKKEKEPFITKSDMLLEFYWY